MSTLSAGATCSTVVVRFFVRIGTASLNALHRGGLQSNCQMLWSGMNVQSCNKNNEDSLCRSVAKSLATLTWKGALFWLS